MRVDGVARGARGGIENVDVNAEPRSDASEPIIHLEGNRRRKVRGRGGCMRACVENPLMELMTSLAVALACTGLSQEESHRLNGLWRSAGVS